MTDALPRVGSVCLLSGCRKCRCPRPGNRLSTRRPGPRQRRHLATSVLERYGTRTHGEGWIFDPDQAAIARKLDDIAEALTARGRAPASSLSWIFGSRKHEDASQGLYIHGAVGRGKTMLMDLFFEAAPIEARRRVHFHAFMSDVHARIHAWRQLKKQHAVKGDDPIAAVASDLAAGATLLCFDEFAVSDIADAMILGRLLAALFANGVTIVATSNVAPRDLYKDGLNRALFLPSIDLIEAHMQVVRLDAGQDYRLTKLSHAGTWFVPDDATATAALDAVFLAMTGRRDGAPLHLPLLGRSVEVPRAAAGVARFAFPDLCERPLGAADFLAVAQAFHTVVVDGIRVIGAGERNVAKRFITLIDTLYDAQVKLIASAAAAPPGLYHAEEGREVFEFQRTVSRLIEMRSDSYLALPHRAASAGRAGDMGGLVET